ncbi:DUF6255 family natural product biosynthesis protein [Streptomyces sp. ISL-11]|uniref:DUF6255 family natural product biosynthesis protein n=1 Tax=Streptomyces sp. ISL-11 TaxID=2819174 RepID=UPI0035B4B433
MGGARLSRAWSGRPRGAEGTRLPCPHPCEGWVASGGVLMCGRCGVRRFTDYRALGPAVEPPGKWTSTGPTVAVTGTSCLYPHIPAVGKPTHALPVPGLGGD